MSDAHNISLDASRDLRVSHEALLVQGGRYRAVSTQPFGRTIMRLQKLSIVVLLLGCVATAACGCRLAKDEVLKIGRKVETELPLGSTKGQATRFLDDMHIENGPGGVQVMDANRYDRLEQISGRVYSYSGGEPAGNLVFFFRDGKLVEWWISSGCGGGCYSMRMNKPMYRSGVTNECYDP